MSKGVHVSSGCEGKKERKCYSEVRQPMGNELGQDAPKPCHGRYRNLGGQEVSTPIPNGLSDVQGSFSAHVQRN